MKIYTKYGDKGFTKLYGGKKVSKNSSRVDAYGTVDEVCSMLGVLVAKMRNMTELEEILKECEKIQQQLFDCGSDLATPDKLREYKQESGDVKWLESLIDKYIPQMPKLESFIIPGGSEISSLFHLIRANIRKLERKIVKLFEENEDVNEYGMQYINRLSDYFFVVACISNVKMGVKEVVYKKSSKVFK